MIRDQVFDPIFVDIMRSQSYQLFLRRRTLYDAAASHLNALGQSLIYVFSSLIRPHATRLLPSKTVPNSVAVFLLNSNKQIPPVRICSRTASRTEQTQYEIPSSRSRQIFGFLGGRDAGSIRIVVAGSTPAGGSSFSNPGNVVDTIPPRYGPLTIVDTVLGRPARKLAAPALRPRPCAPA